MYIIFKHVGSLSRQAGIIPLKNNYIRMKQHELHVPLCEKCSRDKFIFKHLTSEVEITNFESSDIINAEMYYTAKETVSADFIVFTKV